MSPFEIGTEQLVIITLNVEKSQTILAPDRMLPQLGDNGRAIMTGPPGGVGVKRLGDRPSAVERGRWLAELAQAIAEAQRVAQSLSVLRDNCAEAELLYDRLELVRIEVENLRRGGWGARPTQFDPRWTSLFPRLS